MKIGFIGAGGTGKTTIAKALATTLKLPYIPSPSRAQFEKHGVATEDAQRNMTSLARLSLQMDIFHAIDEQVNTTTVGIFDRTHLDNFFYGCFQCHDLLTNDIFNMMDRATYLGLHTFDLLFYAPIYPWQISYDGMRTQSLAARTLCASFTKRYLEHHKFEHYDLPNIDVDERIQYIMDKYEEKE